MHVRKREGPQNVRGATWEGVRKELLFICVCNIWMGPNLTTIDLRS